MTKDQDHDCVRAVIKMIEDSTMKLGDFNNLREAQDKKLTELNELMKENGLN